MEDEVKVKLGTTIRMNANEVYSKLVDSVDFGPHITDKELWYDRVFSECTQEFIDSILEEGVQAPIYVEVLDDDKWKMGNGHHRLCIAMKYDLELPLSVEDDYNLTSNYDLPGCGNR
jgi:hypothetical protein